MKKILLIGNSPLPDESTRSRPAAGLRTFQFLKPLLDRRINDEFNIKLVTIAMPECYEVEVCEKEIDHSKNFSQIIISKNNPLLIRSVQKIYEEFRPDVVAGINTYPSYIASQLKFSVPFWADLNGWIMAEAQAQAYRLNSNDYLPHYYEFEKNILRKADKISVVSEPQKFAVTGELALMGRLNKESFGYEFVEHVPNGTEDFGEEGEDGCGSEPGESGNGACEKLFKNVSIDSFILAWIGGYNTWVDEETLFYGVENAMKKCEKLYFVSTGGEISGLDNKTFTRFKELVDQSEFKNRFVFLGWVETKDIPSIYSRAHFGLNVDRICTETLTGARNRINEMMKFGLPVITTLGSEISYEVEKVGAGVCIESGNKEAFSEAIYKVYEEWVNGGMVKNFSNYGDIGVKYIKEECNYEKIMESFLKWTKDPKVAPDKGVGLNFEPGIFSRGLGRVKMAIKYLKENGVKKSFRKFWQR